MESVTLSTIVLSIVTVIAILWYWSQKRPSDNFPPGPKGWPILGNMLEFTKEAPHFAFMRLAKVYGDVFAVKIGTFWAVILTGNNTIKEALIKNSVDFADRPRMFSGDLFTEGGKDIALGSYGPVWKLQRKLAHYALRNMATGNNERFEDLIFSMTPKVEKVFEEKKGTPFDPKDVVSIAIYNFLAQMTFGIQYELDDPELLEWRSMSQEGIEIMGNGLMADYFSFMQYIPTSGIRGMRKLMLRFKKIITKHLDHHKETFDPDAEPRDMIDMLFKGRQQMIDDGTEGIDLVTDEHIRQTIADIFSGGTDSAIFTIQWIIALLVDFPDVQVKVQKELDDVIGRDALPRMNDRIKLPYTESTLYETLRYSSVSPISLPHSTLNDVTFRGYSIPKGTMVLPVLYSLHFDEKIWGDPENFKPEHFLDESGQLRQHPEGYLPFSTGRRVCIGESVAKAELFLLFAWLFHRYSFTKPPGSESRVYSDVDKTAMNPLLAPFEVIVTKRW